MDAVNVIHAMRTQWRATNGIRYGLDYSALTKEIWASCRIKKADRVQVFEDLQVLEQAALEQMRKNG